MTAEEFESTRGSTKACGDDASDLGRQWTGPSVWGGVVTFNPDIDRLIESVNAIAPQVDRLLVFDNDSDNVAEICRAVSGFAEVIQGRKNHGMAVALNRLASVAENAGATDIVFIDQDSIASDDLVIQEMSCRADDIGIVCCLVIDRNHREARREKPTVLDTKLAITSGSMVNLSAWRVVGGYDERLFVDWVDNEFVDNLRSRGFRLVKTSHASILHELGNQEYAWSLPGGGDRGKKHYYRQNYPAWRWHDRARSQVVTIRKYGWSRIGWEERYYFLRGTLGRILVLEKNKLECLRAVIDGCKSGCRVRLTPLGNGKGRYEAYGDAEGK